MRFTDLDRLAMMHNEPLRTAILRTLAYADLFDYPMTAGEIHRYLIGYPSSLQEVQRSLEDLLVPAQDLCRTNGYYALTGREDLSQIRDRRNETASRLWPLAIQFGQIIGRFPFVRMVAVTGALAVDNVDPGADIDYLIVTAPGRLWLCRASIIVLVRAVAYRGLRLCPNFILSENALRYPYPDLYPAHELAQMVPIVGKSTYEKMRLKNRWTRLYLPNALGSPKKSTHPRDGENPRSWQRKFEAVMKAPLLEPFEQWEMQRKIHKFQLQNPGSTESLFGADCCKGHFDGHAQRTLNLYRRRLQSLDLDLED